MANPGEWDGENEQNSSPDIVIYGCTFSIAFVQFFAEAWNLAA